MIIAIPSVTKYINDSRKSAYVDTAKEVIGSTRNIVNSGELEMYDTNATYYIPTSYIKTENALKSPYGEFKSAYVAVIYDGNGYKYYWISVDESGQGVDELTLYDDLDIDDIKSDLSYTEIENTVKTTGIGGIQSREAKGGPSGEGASTCVVIFSSNAYWQGQTGEGKKYPNNYVYDSNSAIYPYLEYYKTYLEGFGVELEVKLLDNNDRLSLIEHGKDSILYTTSFWRGNSYSYNNNEYIQVYYYSVNNTQQNGVSSPGYIYTFGVRPEVIIKKS